jgi:hypothetical protein
LRRASKYDTCIEDSRLADRLSPFGQRLEGLLVAESGYLCRAAV